MLKIFDEAESFNQPLNPNWYISDEL
jgi:hypothetical protein